MHIVSRAALAFFRTANNAGASDTERNTASTKLHAYCAKHGVDLAYIADAVARDSLTPSEARRQARKPASNAANDAATAARHAANDKAARDAHAKANAAKPEKPSKPASGTPNADAYAERVKLVDALRAIVTGLYNGPSLAVRSNPKRYTDAVYSALFDAPKHRTALDKLTVRDESALFLILQRGERNGSFDPVALNLDSGIFSRLRSVGFIQRDGASYMLTTDALAHARAAAKRAKQAA